MFSVSRIFPVNFTDFPLKGTVHVPRHPDTPTPGPPDDADVLTAPFSLFQVTIADLYSFHILSLATHGNAELLADMPKVAEHITKVSSLPNVKAWVDKRPPTLW
jgi:hypothetical protein